MRLSDPRADKLRKIETSLDELADNGVEPFTRIADRMVAKVFRGGDLDREIDAMSDLFAATLTLADLSGRIALLEEAEETASRRNIDTSRHDGPLLFRDVISPVVPGVDFDQALEDFASRSPILQEEMDSGRPRYLEIQRLYKERHAFGLARSFSDQLTRRVQSVIQKSIEAGDPVKDTIDAIKRSGGFTRAYSETVYRTNLSSAYTAGRFRQMQEPGVQLVFGGFEFVAVVDPATRDNHLAAHGLVAGTNDPIWDQLSPPLGYNCRCAVFPVDRLKLQEMGLIGQDGRVGRRPTSKMSQAHADGDSFGRRPDTGFYS